MFPRFLTMLGKKNFKRKGEALFSIRIILVYLFIHQFISMLTKQEKFRKI